MFGTEEPPPKHDSRDLRHPRHPKHAESLSIRSRIARALVRQDFTTQIWMVNDCTAQGERGDLVESSLEILFSDSTPNGLVRRDPSGRDIDAESKLLMTKANDINWALHQAYVEFLELLQDTKWMRMRSTTRIPTGPVESQRYHLGPRISEEWKRTDSSSKEDGLSLSTSMSDAKNRSSTAIQQRIAVQSALFMAASSHDTTTVVPPLDQYVDVNHIRPQLRQSLRIQSRKRFRYEPEAMGQGPKESSAFSSTALGVSPPKHLIVDTGASHVLFRQEDASHLSNVQMSLSPFAVLKAANGALLDSIGRGMFTIGMVTVIPYIFKDGDLVHNLLRIAPFADRGLKATF